MKGCPPGHILDLTYSTLYKTSVAVENIQNENL